uniref:Uncharacterized protein n=1 Tax=Lates calcarifer TaxID=8187 RepID=A0A4W6FM61_LATCA
MISVSALFIGLPVILIQPMFPYLLPVSRSTCLSTVHCVCLWAANTGQCATALLVIALHRVLIAGIISRESRAGKALDRGGSNPFQILVELSEKIQEKFPSWSRKQQLKGIVAYMDKNTTSGNYSNDVVARAYMEFDN